MVPWHCTKTKISWVQNNNIIMTGIIIIWKTLSWRIKIKNKNTTDLLVTWPPSWIIFLPWLNAGSCHKLPSFIIFFNSVNKNTTSKNAQRKRNTQGQISTASTTAQHPRNLLLWGPLHYEIRSLLIQSNDKKKKCVTFHVCFYWFKTLQPILHNSWAFFTHFLT